MLRLSSLSGVLRRLARNKRGSVVIETAIVAPMLVMMSIGTFEVSRMISRQHELQSGVSEATSIALAANMGAETQTTELKNILKESLDLDDNDVSVVKLYRCNVSSEMRSSANGCDGSNDVLSTYVRITLTDTYSPVWSHMGVAGDFNYSVTRTVQLS